MDPEYAVQRRHARLTFRQVVSGGITAAHGVQLVELSLGGARVEHTVVLRPGKSCYLRMPSPGRTVTLAARVVWSKVVGRAEAEGKGGLRFQSGLEFGPLPPETHALLDSLLVEQGMLSANRGRPD